MTGDPGLLTADEHDAMRLTAELADLLGFIIGDGPGTAGDRAEAVGHLHSVQHLVLAQAAARAYPDRYRLLGAGPLQRIGEAP